jgi:hypothetical protein
MKRLMKRFHGGSVGKAIEDLVRLTGHCRTTQQRLAILEPYFEGRLAKITRGDEEAATQARLSS